MEIWRDIILIISVLSFFAFGYFLMTKLDKFFEVNYKSIEKEEEKKEPSLIFLTEKMSDEEIATEVKRFKEKHTGARIILYDSTSTDLSEIMDDYANRKQ